MSLPDRMIDARFRAADCIFFVIGAQKSATTWLQNYFESHPEICVPYWKEQNYWSVMTGRLGILPNLIAAERQNLGFGARKIFKRLKNRKHRSRCNSIKWTLKAQRHPGPPHTAYADALFQLQDTLTVAVGDVSPSYSLMSSDGFAQMSAINENVRFVFAMRDPASRFVSSAKHEFRVTTASRVPTQAVLSREVAQSITNRTSAPVRTSAYHKTIAQLEAVIPPQQIFYVFFEDLFEQSKIDELCDFLGVSRWPADFEKAVNADSAPSLRLPDHEFSGVVDSLTEVYETIFAKFGDRVPAAWRASYAKRSVAHA